MADEYIKRKDIVSALWIALYAYEDKTEKQFKEDPNLETGEWFDHRIFVQACHAECLEEVLAIPSADVVEVVRCKDCKNNYVTTHNHGKQDDPRCDFTDRHLSLDDFCSRGERRMDGGT